MKLISSFVELFLLLHLLVAGHVFQLIEGELLNENKRKLSSRPFNFHKVIKDKNALSRKDIVDKYKKFKQEKINKIDDLINFDGDSAAKNQLH